MERRTQVRNPSRREIESSIESGEQQSWVEQNIFIWTLEVQYSRPFDVKQ